ncbi:MAG: response regulator, partial [Gemmatimonadaceae bacterium]|nr:response regulator [Gemmatimonadaceae bacterium]
MSIILVVDDNEADRFVVQRILEEDGHQVIEASSGASALEALERYAPDMLVLDVRLPDANGFDLTRRFKTDRTANSPVVLLLSATFTTPESKAKGLESGADGYLTHPVEPLVLTATVRALLRTRRIEADLATARDELASQLADMRRLHALTTRLHGIRDVPAMLKEVLATVVEIQRGASGVLLLYDEARNDLCTVASVGLSDDYLRRIARISANEGACGLAVTEKRSVVVEDAEHDPIQAPLRDVVRSAGVRGVFSVPLVGRAGAALGVIASYFEVPHRPTEHEQRLVELYAQHASWALEVTRLYEREQEARAHAERARREAEAANRAKSEFLATMSHELRTPLNAIAGYTELLQMGLHGPITDAQREALDRIQRSQRYLLGLINDLLNFARVEAGQVRYEVRSVPIEHVLRTVEALISTQLRAKDLTYVCEACEESVSVLGDAERVQQVLLNVLTNASKFTGPGGRITLRCEATPMTVHFHVTDTGSGIPADKLETIFEPFVQVEKRPARSGDGVGLGLANSRQLARA